MKQLGRGRKQLWPNVVYSPGNCVGEKHGELWLGYLVP